MNYTAPSFKSDAFHCPICGTYAHMHWDRLKTQSLWSQYYLAKCAHCEKTSLWRQTAEATSNPVIISSKGEMIFPDHGSAPLAEIDMPNDVQKDYHEAARIYSRSPRSAAALLRLGLQKLCKHLGEDGKNIHDDIRSLAAKNTLPPLVVKVADTVRITGNNAVHPGTMSNKDIDYVASKMFGLLNFIVKKGISEPRELEELYNLTPEAPRKAAEEKDEEARQQ